MLALEAWAGVTKRAAGHIWTALGQMVLCFRAARVTWEAIWCERAQIRHVMKNDLRGDCVGSEMEHIWLCAGGYTHDYDFYLISKTFILIICSLVLMTFCIILIVYHIRLRVFIPQF